MKNAPPAGFLDFVVARGSALHRTAALLAGQGQVAADLSQIALARAWQSWSRIDGNHEAHVRRIMVNEFTRHPTTAAVATTSPVQRAVVVLRFFHDYTEVATAEALNLTVAAVRSQTLEALASLRISEEQLRAALHEAADGTAYPDVDALVTGAQRRVAATGRRRLRALGATALVVLVAGGLLATTTGSTDNVVPPPPKPSPFTVNTVGAGFPAYSQGMKRLTVLDAPMLVQTNDSIVVPTTPGQQLFVAMTCTPDASMETRSDWDVRMYASFTVFGGEGGRPGCDSGMGLGGYPMIGRAIATKTTVTADVFIDHTALPAPGLLFKDAKIHVAIYGSVPWKDYPLPARPADIRTNEMYAPQSIPDTVRVLGPATADAANKPLTFTQPFYPDQELYLEVRGPGRMRVLINGKDVGERVPLSTTTADGLLSFWAYQTEGHEFSFFSSPTGPEPERGTPVTVRIVPQDFRGPDWRIAVVRAPPNG